LPGGNAALRHLLIQLLLLLKLHRPQLCHASTTTTPCHSPAGLTSSYTISTDIGTSTTANVQFSKTYRPGAYLHLKQGKATSVLFRTIIFHSQFF